MEPVESVFDCAAAEGIACPGSRTDADCRAGTKAGPGRNSERYDLG